MPDTKHTPVLLTETVDGLNLTPGATALDATFGAGGHSRAIADVLGADGTLIVLDADKEATDAAPSILADAKCTTHIVHENFREIDRVLKDLDLTTVDAICADLGWRTEQVLGTDQAGRGFTFQREEPLIMTYGESDTYPFTARDIVNTWSRESIANVLFGYAEERFARRIAKRITEVRDATPIETTTDLVEVIESTVPVGYKRGRIHPATKTFQALRIAVNDELAALTEFIEKSVAHLTTGGRLAIITFHSIEDRIVKQRFRDLAKDGYGTVLTKKPIAPSREEQQRNPRARSAHLRIFSRSI